MVVVRSYQLALLAAALLWQTRTDARSAAVKFCGRQLGEIMSRVCHTYNSPAWDVPTVVEQHGSLQRRKRQLGIADECCTHGCTWEQLSKYCSVSAYSESPLDDLEMHTIEDRSAEEGNVAPVVIGRSHKGSGAGAGSGEARADTRGDTRGEMHGETRGEMRGETRGEMRGQRRGESRREVGRARSRGYGRARGRRCWCRRKRRSGRRLSSLMGNMDLIKNAARAAPVVGTVSPLLTWGRTLNTDLPPNEQDRYAYVAVYT